MTVSIKEIKARLGSCPPAQLPGEIEKYQCDQRKGVQAALLSAQKRYQRSMAELERMDALWRYERLCYKQGYEMVAGIDEVGRGPLAGPVMTAAVILPRDCNIPGVNDSKKLTPKKREELYEIIKEKAVAFAFGSVSPKGIDQMNILQATLAAMREAVGKLATPPDFVLADAVSIPGISMPQMGIVQGDAKSISIGAASILAKVERDRLMVEMDGLYPQYGFAENKGYGTKAHVAAIKTYGLCPIHRLSFVKNIVPQPQQTAHNRQKGKEGEDIAAAQMETMGYTLVERNFRGVHGEIDIIAKKDDVMVFTEVKYRKSFQKGLPREAVHYHKQQHILHTAMEYIAAHDHLGDYRFDVAEVTEMDGKKYFHYIENAFGAE